MTKNNFDIGEWFSEKENRNIFFKFMIGLNLIAFSALLFVTADGSGALYEVLKPSDNTFNYTLVDQYENTALDATHDNAIIIEAILLNEYFEEIGDVEKIYLSEKFMYNNLVNGERISIRYVQQFFEDEYIHSVAQYRNSDTMAILHFNS